MKFFFLITIVLLLASCGNQKIRFKRVQSNTQTVVKVDKETRASIKLQRNSNSAKEELAAEVDTRQTVPPVADEAKTQSNEVITEKALTSSPVSENQASTDEEKVKEALEAEKNATRAQWLLIAALPGFFLLIIPGVVLFIIGAIYYFKARNAQYISEKGQKALELARIFYLIDFILTAALVIGIAGLIINSVI